MEQATFAWERYLDTAFDAIICGVDEAGRGPLAGPVVAAACAVKDVALYAGDTPPQGGAWRLVRDSKTLSPKQRAEAFAWVKTHFDIGVGVSSPETIDRINILQATFLAMKKAVQALERVCPRRARLIVLVDGNQPIANSSYVQHCVPRGDAKVVSIAAASIVAKVTRDTMMTDYDRQYPLYGFAAHKGYGTAAHMNALRTYGATPIHRKSFAPVAALCAAPSDAKRA